MQTPATDSSYEHPFTECEVMETKGTCVETLPLT